MLQRIQLELWVGIFVALGLLALAMLALRVGNLSTADVVDGYKLEAHFDNIGSLKVKSPVTMAGVRIGRVSQIGFDYKNYQALVILNIDGRYKTIPKDTGASILTAGLLGEQYIGLDPGGSDQYLKDGDKITMTQSAIVLEKLIGQFIFGKAGESEPNKKP
ncbi:MAG TPA: outer membrane lipid asymmetry maintenance protein MlaD [Acidiferrobacterales bacterium]|nr:outer membrane lipid asymmetry maintenance protein MlaD [Acidiferrobacterales bacterium]